MDKQLLELRKAFPWPQNRPDGTERHWGWISSKTKRSMQQIMAKRKVQRGTILELGTLYGKSAKWWLRRKFQHVICNDLFQYKHAGGTHYKDFIYSNWDMKEKFTALKMRSQIALTTVKSFNVPVSVVYIDACHEFAEAATDTLLAYQLFYPDSLIIGDDWHFPTVNKAVHFAAGIAGFEFEVIGNSWYIK